MPLPDGPESLYTDGENFMTGIFVLMLRGMSIAGGTSEIKRNQIGERILGLPGDPSVKYGVPREGESTIRLQTGVVSTSMGFG